MNIPDILKPTDTFVHRHIGPNPDDIQEMLSTLGLPSLDALIDATIPADIRLRRPLTLGPHRGEHEVLTRLRAIAAKNKVLRSCIGMGYSDTITPPVIQRNILENPGWYTQYTPYQAEISQGRLEALLNFQTMVADLTGLPLANASLLDEATAAAEAMSMCRAITHRESGEGKEGFFVLQDCHPQTIAVLQTRAQPLGINLHIGPRDAIDFARQRLFGVILQDPATDGAIRDYRELVTQAHEAGALVVVGTDLLALTVLRSPGEFGADIAVGSSQRFGVPLGFGGPHAAFLSTREEYKRQLPGRLVGVSKDAQGKQAYRLTLQTREQHIRRDKATSNICTAQVLLAVMASMYAVYHGPEGLKQIADRVHGLTLVLAQGLRRLGCQVASEHFFDTVQVRSKEESADRTLARAYGHRINLRRFGACPLGLALDEVTTPVEIQALFDIFAAGRPVPFTVEELAVHMDLNFPAAFARTTKYLSHPVFNRHHSQQHMLRYLYRLHR